MTMLPAVKNPRAMTAAKALGAAARTVIARPTRVAGIVFQARPVTAIGVWHRTRAFQARRRALLQQMLARVATVRGRGARTFVLIA